MSSGDGWLGRIVKSRLRADDLTQESSSSKDGHSQALSPAPSGDNQILADDLGSGVICLFLANLGIAGPFSELLALIS